MKKIFFLYLALIFSISISLCYAKNSNKLVAGPMQGHTTINSVKFWFLIKKTKLTHVKIKKTNALNYEQTLIIKTDSLPAAYKGQHPVVVEFKNLQAATLYDLCLSFDQDKETKIVIFKTLEDTTIQDFSFLTGSCALQVGLIFRPFIRLGTDKIFKKMTNVPADFMLWLGDNSYYLKKDFATANGMWRRQIKTRKVKNLNKFLCTYPQYAIWDDHDYGAYDGDTDFPLKDTSLFLYNNFWVNPSSGLPENRGIYTSFRKYDSEFILLDDRFYRMKPNVKNGTMLGPVQLNWLFEKLKKSDATFKFIVIGTQFLNPNSVDECYNQFPEEKLQILDFIEKNKIKGVIIISGDAHSSDLQKLERPNNYTLYDFTCSPLTSFLEKPSPQNTASKTRVPNTLTVHRNFGHISVKGPKDARVCTITLYDDYGKFLWDYAIPATALQ